MWRVWMCGVALAAGVDGGPEGHTLVVQVQGLQDQRGAVECVLWSGPVGFPRETERGLAKVTARPLATGEARCVFEGVAPGTYAVSFIHDQNENGKMDLGVFGIPQERYGFSRDPKPFMRPPRFDEASFTLDAPLTLQATAR